MVTLGILCGAEATVYKLVWSNRKFVCSPSHLSEEEESAKEFVQGLGILLASKSYEVDHSTLTKDEFSLLPDDIATW